MIKNLLLKQSAVCYMLSMKQVCRIKSTIEARSSVLCDKVFHRSMVKSLLLKQGAMCHLLIVSHVYGNISAIEARSIVLCVKCATGL